MSIPARTLLAAVLTGATLLAGAAITGLEPAIAYPGVRIAAVTRVANRNYLADVAAGTDVLTGRRFDLGQAIRLPAKSVVILDI